MNGFTLRTFDGQDLLVPGNRCAGSHSVKESAESCVEGRNKLSNTPGQSVAYAYKRIIVYSPILLQWRFIPLRPNRLRS